MDDNEIKQLALKVQIFLMNPSSPAKIKYQIRREIAVNTQSLDCTNLEIIQDYLRKYKTKNSSKNSENIALNTGIN